MVFDDKLKIDKAAIALISGVLCWFLYYLTVPSVTITEKELIYKFGEISSILFFLLGAMTIVEMIDLHQGFNLITNAIQTKSKSKLLILIVLITFFLSSILDNLTTAIIMASLSRKIIPDKNERRWFIAMIIIAANAGGAWSPLGDVTTTMLWIGGQITPLKIIEKTFFPCLVAAEVPLIILLFKFKGQKVDNLLIEKHNSSLEGNIVLFTGLGCLLLIPVFKALTHMPQFMGMLLAIGIIWIVSSIIHLDKHPEIRYRLSVGQALRKIDTSSILFFLGILLSVAALHSFGILTRLAEFTVSNIKSMYLTGTVLGLFSAVIDNVPLVAAVQGMFDLNMYPADHLFWEFISLSTGTGGSLIIFGSAAGVAMMGIEQINFFWYIKNISFLALLGFASGIGVYILQQLLFI